MSRQKSSAFAAIAAVAVVASVIAGFFVLGNPEKQRKLQWDENRVEDLRKISRATDVFWTRKGHLPASLSELLQEPGITVNIKDPKTKRDYVYHPVEKRAYELCAEFEDVSTVEFYWDAVGFWSHGAGRQCFRLQAKTIRQNEGYPIRFDDEAVAD